ncbi:phage major capsid protein, HK97 family [Methylocella silvestris BL2]|uniref:Phage major capsid protein, HK97 family n=1 Tax=Methylocella silvestris (strain DSM 15510 / CIP 108128 / LMG 27833 / NCIMB 13906 / BL2) TaxID=395965 RepID=B8ESX9_METSB|nr:phage major capsid protein [Methylocella silvestris]ACK51117.1 phage major capsid protein, HK97 family [Methylocella silvestris BL2]
MLAPGAQFTQKTADSADAIFAAIDRLDGDAEAKRAHDEIRAARSAFVKALRLGHKALSAQEARHLGDAQQARVLNIAEATPLAGGYLLPAPVAASLLRRVELYTPVASVARVITTDTGGPLSWPLVDEASMGAGIVAENSTLNAVDMPVGTLGLNASKFSSGIIPVSLEVLQDSAVNIEDMLLDLLAARLARGMNSFFTSGTGVNQPQGALTGASLGVTLPAANTTSLTSDGLIALYSSVDAAYRQSLRCVWMMNDMTLLAVQKIAAAQGWPLWFPDPLLQPGGPPPQGRLFGRPVVINNDMPAMAASAKPILFGDFASFVARFVNGAAILRMNDSGYLSKGQTAFVAFARADSRVANWSAGAALRYLQNSAS